MLRDRRKSRLLLALSGLLVCALTSVTTAQDSAAPRKKVLVLYWDSKDFPGNVSFDQGFQASLNSDPSIKLDLYSEYLDSQRFPGERQTELLYEYLLGKYSGQKIDVVVATPDPALSFLLKYRKHLFANTPIVFVAVQRPALETLTAGAGLTGIIRANTQRRTLDLALKLHPQTKDVFVISGTPEHDKRFENISREELAGYESRIRLNYLTDLSVSDLVERVKSLPRDSIILYVWQRTPVEEEKLLQTYQVLEKVRQAAPVPIYGMGSRNVGYGIVGGYVQDSERNGLETADIVRRILSGTPTQSIPVDSASSVPMFDWRELQRWGISESSLPSGSVVRFKELTLWEQYKWRIIGLATLIAVQTLIIALLLAERRQRRLAKEALDRLNAELETRIEQRTAALNAKSRELETFAYSVAHDLKAPLRGIDGYSRLLLEDYAGRLEGEGENFLQIIQRSTDEMNQLIDDLLAYSRFERRELHTGKIELAPIVTSLVEEKRREAARSIDFVVDVNGGTVLADASGLSQSLRNYLDNAVKFTRNVDQPRIEIGTKEDADTCVIWVRDNGIGFDMKYHDRIFDIFQRLGATEDYPGTGIGLAIVRKAMERMGGRAWAESHPGAGATFYLEIPR
ncbi:MAG TPA: ABC transporter substrate binding protein [Pyrinomonadaceae bacterium]|nr:ABC transporter substrate binding protein [Pyrinomonadaceae bacterium]